MLVGCAVKRDSHIKKRNTLKRYIENTVKGENDTKKKHIENHLGQLKTQSSRKGNKEETL